MNTNTTITRELIRTARTLKAECWQVCREAWVWGQREMNSSIGLVWAAGLQRVRARSCLVRFEPYELFISLIFFFSPR